MGGGIWPPGEPGSLLPAPQHIVVGEVEEHLHHSQEGLQCQGPEEGVCVCVCVLRDCWGEEK